MREGETNSKTLPEVSKWFWVNLAFRSKLSTYSGCKFNNILEEQNTPHINLSDHNENDIDVTIKVKLKDVLGWSQIRVAGRPFLECIKKNKLNILTLKDPAAVRRFFVHDGDYTAEKKI